MIDSIKKYFLSSYEEHDYSRRQKAFILMVLSFVAIFLFSAALIVNLLTKQSFELIFGISVDLILIVSAMGTMYLLKNNRYNAAVMVILSGPTAAILWGCYQRIGMLLQTYTMSFYYFFFAMITIVALLGTRKMMMAVALFFGSALNVVYVYLYTRLPGVNANFVSHVVNLNISFIITACLLYLIMKISEKALVDVQHELVKNRELSGSLERKVEHRTRELAKANENLKYLDRAKSVFFSNVSHELRTPLTLILSPVESILQGGYPGKVDEDFFRKLYNNGRRLLGLINNLLDFSKIEAGRMVLRLKMVDVSKELGLCVANVHSGAISKGLSIEYADNSGGLVASLDRELFIRAVYNLLGNAIKFTPEGGRIDVVLSASDGLYTVAFHDTGIGISPEKHEMIFDRFAQADSTSSRKYEGTGIGLSLTREIARLHGGDVTVESQMGKGSTFYLTLPVRVSESEALSDRDDVPREEYVSAAPADITVEGIPAVSAGGEQESCGSLSEEGAAGDGEPLLLIVEDNRDMRSFIAEIVRNEYRVLTAQHGKEALEKLDSLEEPPDLIVSDVMMPEMDGYELTKRVREDARYEGIPIILLTAKAETSMKLEGFGRGATDYVVKPFNAGELLARMKAQLELKALRDRLVKANAALYRKLQEQTAGKPAASVSASAEEKVAHVEEFIRENYTSDLSREGLAAAVGLSSDHLSRAFNKVTGKRIDEYINELRVEEARRRLRETEETIISIAFDVGFENVRTFNKVFGKIAGMTPSEWRKNK